jgi:hypothetical protein
MDSKPQSKSYTSIKQKTRHTQQTQQNTVISIGGSVGAIYQGDVTFHGSQNFTMK